MKGILQPSNGVLHFALRPVGLGAAFEIGVDGNLDHGLNDSASCLLRRALDPIIVLGASLF